ncbi:hypothetical protein BDQ17DRAFT_413102 [Cyathus striatus]|nr:hypothetical protein BDQ17DRAFT_413102 [Cyathus striatus]
MSFPHFFLSFFCFCFCTSCLFWIHYPTRPSPFFSFPRSLPSLPLFAGLHAHHALHPVHHTTSPHLHLHPHSHPSPSNFDFYPVLPGALYLTFHGRRRRR